MPKHVTTSNDNNFKNATKHRPWQQNQGLALSTKNKKMRKTVFGENNFKKLENFKKNVRYVPPLKRVDVSTWPKMGGVSETFASMAKGINAKL